LPILPFDSGLENSDKLFPLNKVDEYGEPIDNRKKTSWNSKVDEINPLEAMEVQIVNSIVPFTIISQLLPMMKNTLIPNIDPFDMVLQRKFIINVSAPEGQFAQIDKTAEHAHTNMAKASLNMITRTIANDCKQSNIYVTSVDTGWVSRMRPGLPNDNSIEIPLIMEDAAARILHPIVEGLNDKNIPKYGAFLKHFQVVPW